MLRSIIKSNHLLTASRRTLSLVAGEPSLTTTVVLKNISPLTTEASLKAGLSEINFRKVEIEPGCSIHVRNEAEAIHVSSSVASKFNYEGAISGTTMPSLLLQNLPSSICSDHLKKIFGKFDPKTVRLIGTKSIQVTLQSAKEAVIAQNLLSKTSIDGRNLSTHTVKLPDQTFAVVVSNFNADLGFDLPEKTVREALQGTFATGDIDIKKLTVGPRKATLRFDTTNAEEIEKVIASLQTMTMNKGTLQVDAPRQIKKPALFIRNVRKIGSAKLLAVMNQMNCERIRINDRTKDVESDLAVAFFATEEVAFQALHTLKTLRIEGVKIAASFREVAEPAITVKNLPKDITEKAILDLYSLYKPIRATLTHTDEGAEAVIVLGGPADVTLAVAAMGRKSCEGQRMLVTETPIHDTGIDVFLKDSPDSSPGDLTASELFNSLLNSGAKAPKGITFHSNVSAFVSFLSIEKAVSAHTSFLEGGIVLNTKAADGDTTHGLVTSRISAVPSYVVEVSGMSTDTPFNVVKDALSGASSLKEGDGVEGEGETVAAAAPADFVPVDSLRIDRTAIIKFKKAGDVVFNMKKLKSTIVDGSTMKASKYRPVVKHSDNEIDERDGVDEQFDQYGLASVLKDYMYADKATRYQIVKNHFERAVTNAKEWNDPLQVLDTGHTPALAAEVKALLVGSTKEAIKNERLFQIYTQKEEMNMLVHDFRETEAFFGPADETDMYNWSQFLIENSDDLEKYTKDVRKVEAEALQKANEAAGILPVMKLKQRKLLVVTGDEGEKVENVELGPIDGIENVPGIRNDVWSGAILDTDMVQNVMPGGRIMSHRCLVVVGNLKGAAGFGVGKSSTPDKALNLAFRDALRNLTFIDLYEQSGFAHDLHGRHNSCQAYIRATDRSRMMVASPFASAVLERFGVGSASVKLIGRRDPYAMVRAIFDAVRKHENIDEFAKDRGKRYLDLKWLHDNNI